MKRSGGTRTSIPALLLSIGLLALLPSSPASAFGGEKGDWEFGLFAGYGLLDDYEPKNAPAFALNPADDLLWGTRIGYFITPGWSIEGSFQRLTTETEFASGPPQADVDIDSFRLNFLYNFRQGRVFRPYLTFGGGIENFNAGGLLDESDSGLNAGGGLRWLWGAYGLRLDARAVNADVGGIVDNAQTNIEASVGLTLAFGGGPPPDEDGDGVPDRRDHCPGTPRGAKVDDEGCPIDSDGDGVPDGIDRCPDTPAGYAVDATGCSLDTDGDGVNDALDKCPGTPAGATVDATGCPLDSDGDGVYDGIDECPDTPSGATVDARGCPNDSDGDGVYDGIDQCPGTPGGATVDATGCPQDSDGDGVYDGIDQCPDTPAGTKVNALGCTVLFVEDQKTFVLKDVNFEFDSASLTVDSNSILDSVAVTLSQIAVDLRVEVAGHSDSSGPDAYNLRLSQKRADAVRTYLIGKGIASSRIVAKGYGEAEPVADNSTKEGQAKNRRVELRRLN